MIISLCGHPGSGKSAIAQLLAEKLGWERYGMGDLRRQMAKKRGITLDELNRLGETEAFTDQEVDEYQKRLGQEKDNFVIEGRTSFHFIPHSFKVFITVDPAEGAWRIYEQTRSDVGQERNEKVGNSVGETQLILAERCASDVKRYQKYYGFDCYDTSHYDLVLDSTGKTPAKVVAEILAHLPQ